MGPLGTVLFGIISIIAGVYIWLLSSGRIDPPDFRKQQVKAFFQDRSILIKIISLFLIINGLLSASHINELLG